MIVNNAINLKEYQFNAKKREQYRNKYHLNNKLVIGHIGRFNKQKNHKFLIDLFCKIKEERQDAILVLIGDGPLKKKMEKRVKKKGIEKSVLFLGVRKDIPELLQMIDIFVLPSRFEGLGIALIEAQASGLVCYASESTPRDTQITELVKYLSIDEGVYYWEKEILKTQKNIVNRKNISSFIENTKFNIKVEAAKVENFYLSLK